MRAALPLLVVLLSTSVSAAEWLKVADLGADGSLIAVDRSGIARTNKVRKAWFKSTYKKPQRIPDGVPKADPNEFYYSESIALYYFICTERMTGSTQAIYRDAAGKVVATYEDRNPFPHYSDVAPETIGEMMLNVACGWKFPGDAAKK